MKECGQIAEMILLDKSEHQCICCGVYIFCRTFSPSLDLSVCYLPFSSFTACLSPFFTLSNLYFYLPLSACHRLFGPSSFPFLSPLVNTPCPSLSLPFLSLLCSVSWNYGHNVKTCPKTFPFLWYCGLITDILVFCLPKCIVVKSLVPVILNLQENQKQLFHSNDLH